MVDWGTPHTRGVPVARRLPGERRALLAAGLGVAFAVALVALLLVLSTRPDVKVQLGDDEFGPVDVENQAEAIERDGPVLLPDASPNRDRPIFLQHLGEDPAERWLALSARAPDAEQGCFLEWDADGGRFVDGCTGDRYPADGEGLTQYEVRVEDGDLFVDLRDPVDG